MKHAARQGCAIGIRIAAGVLLAVVATASAAPVGTAFTYQGRLEDGQTPANGTYDLEFRLFDAASGGTQVGPTVTASAVAVADGWVTAGLDFGAVFAGNALWLEIRVRPTGGGGYVTLTPRRELTPTPNAAWAEDAAHAATADDAAHAATADTATTAQLLGGLPAGAFLDISTSSQFKAGSLVVGATSGTSLDYGIEAYGFNGGGRFADDAGSALALLGQAATGVAGMGDFRGGYFQTTSGTGEVSLAMGDRGVEASGSEAGGYFEDVDGSGFAFVGFGHIGIEASGSVMGGYFADASGTASAEIASSDLGVLASGALAGGMFADTEGSGYAYLGYGDIGVEAHGSEAGGYFADQDSGAGAYLGYADCGIQAYGTDTGGFFSDSDQTGSAYIGRHDYGIMAYGDSASYFQNSSVGVVSYAHLASTEYGTDSYGPLAGGRFEDSDDSGYAYAGWGDLGLRGFGDAAGGFFQDLTSNSHAYAGYGSYKIQGNGTVSFVQNHPYDDSKVVVYHAPEASDVAVYTRGSGRLEGGRAVVALDPTFALVANPDLGLTAHLTARGELVELATETISTGELVVIGPAGSSAVFDYMVWGLRIGFEELAPVQLKEREAFIPSMHDHRELYDAEPSLRGFNAFERFAAAERELKGLEKTAPLGLERAEALKNAIHEFDPAVDPIPERDDRPEPPELGDRFEPDGPKGRHGPTLRRAVAEDAGDSTVEQTNGQPAIPAGLLDADRDLDARSLSTEGGELAVELPAVAGIVPGDVVAVDPDSGMLVQAAEGGDPRVVGIAAHDPGVVLGTGTNGDPLRARVALSGLTTCRVDAGYGDILPGDLLIASPTPGHAMRAGGEPLPGSVVAKALEPLGEGQGTIRVLVWLR